MSNSRYEKVCRARFPLLSAWTLVRVLFWPRLTQSCFSIRLTHNGRSLGVLGFFRLTILKQKSGPDKHHQSPWMFTLA